MDNPVVPLSREAKISLAKVLWEGGSDIFQLDWFVLSKIKITLEQQLLHHSKDRSLQDFDLILRDLQKFYEKLQDIILNRNKEWAGDSSDGLDLSAGKTALLWRLRGKSSPHPHEHFNFYHFGRSGRNYCLILESIRRRGSRTQLDRLYYQPVMPDPIQSISSNPNMEIVCFRVKLAPLAVEIKNSLLRKNVQAQLNAKMVALWEEYFRKHSKTELEDTLPNQAPISTIIDFFTKNGAFVHSIVPSINSLLSKPMNANISKMKSSPADIAWISEVLNSNIMPSLERLHRLKDAIQNKPPLILGHHFCITLDLVPQLLWAEILANDLQIQEWRELFPGVIPDRPSPEFLKVHPSLMIDTKYFSPSYVDLLYSSVPSFEGLTEGYIIQSESRHALRALVPKFAGTVDFIYADPPYNTGNNEFLYRDSLGHSNWLEILAESIQLWGKIGQPSLNFFISIDDNEFSRLNLLIEELWGKDVFFGPVIVQVNRGGRDYLPIAKTHEYLIVGNRKGDKARFNEIPKPLQGTIYQDPKGEYILRELRNRNPKFNRTNRPNLYYPFFVDPTSADADGLCTIALEETSIHNIQVLPLTSKNVEDCWRWGVSKARDNINSVDSRLSEIVARQKRGGGWNIYEKHRKAYSKAKSVWLSSAVRTEAGTIDIRHLFGSALFDHPKPTALIQQCLAIGTHPESLILDPFAGSGTTAHAAIAQNHLDGGRRRYILIEKGESCNDVIIPRIKKLTFSLDWHEGIPGKPQHRSKIIEYGALEQYEDVLFNLDLAAEDPENQPGAKLLASVEHQTDRNNPPFEACMSYCLEKEATPQNTPDNPHAWGAIMENWHFCPQIPSPVLSRHPNMYCYRPEASALQPIDTVQTLVYMLGVAIGKRKVWIDARIRYEIILGRTKASKIAILWSEPAEYLEKRPTLAQTYLTKEGMMSEIITWVEGGPLYTNEKDIDYSGPIHHIQSLWTEFQSFMG